MQDHVTKTIFFRFTNRFTKRKLLTVQIPYIPFMAINGYYSGLYRRMKYGCAFQCEQAQVTGRKWFESIRTKRVILTFENGFVLDMPNDINDKDITIINHYLEGIKISLSK